MFDDKFNRFDTDHAFDRQTDRMYSGTYTVSWKVDHELMTAASNRNTIGSDKKATVQAIDRSDQSRVQKLSMRIMGVPRKLNTFAYLTVNFACSASLHVDVLNMRS